MSLKLHEYNETDFGGGCLAYLDRAVGVAVTKNLDSPYTLSFEYPINDEKETMIEVNRIVSVGGQGYRINDVTRTYGTERMMTVSATHVFFADAQNRHLPTIGIVTDVSKSTIGADPYKVIKAAIENAEFDLFSDDELEELGMTRIGADGTKIDFYPTDKINVYDAIMAVIENYGKGELYVDNYSFAVVERIGEDSEVRLSLKKNLTKLSVQRQTTELVTRLYPYGADDLTISSVTDDGEPYIESNTDKYGVIEAYKDYSDYDEPKKLLQLARWDLSGNGNDYRLDTPQLTITGDIVDLSKLAEYGDAEKLSLGDTVQICENDTVYEKRIISITHYPYSSEQTTVTIGVPSNTNQNYGAWLQRKLFKSIKKNTTSTSKLKTKYLTGTVNSTQNPVRSANKKLLLDGDLLCIEDDDDKTRIKLGNDDDTFVFAIYDKNGDETVYMNDDGEAVFAGTIQTGKDCLIQGALRVGMGGNNPNGIEFYGDSYTESSEMYARILPYVDAYDDKIKGINVAGNLWVGDYKVATEVEIESLKAEIKELKALIEE